MNGRSTDSIDCLLSYLSYSRSALPTDSHTNPPPPPTSGGNHELEPKTAELRVDHAPLIRGLGFHKNVHVSDSKLTLGLQVGFISSHLIADKLFPVIRRAIPCPPNMSLLFEAKSQPPLVIKERHILLIVDKNDLRWYIMSNQQG